MASADRTAADPLDLLERLEREPWAFDFFQLVRRLECLYRDHPRLGRTARPSEDFIRLGQEPYLTFAPSALASLERPEGRPPRLAVHFFGLFGPNGPLPLHLSVHARERIRDAGDRTLSRFADMFHHRMMSFFFRAWADAQPSVAFDRPDSDRFALYVGSLFGMTDASRVRDALPSLTQLRYAGQLAAQTRNPEALRAILGDFFDVPVQLREFVGEWTDLPESWWCLLGRSPETGTLGRTLTLGGRVWESRNKFRLVLGPLALADYDRFLPGGPRLARFVSLVRGFTNDQWSFDVQLILRRDDVVPTVLGRGNRLGWTTWIACRALDRDPGDLIVDPRPRETVAEMSREVPS